jgi:hypothetical protein
MQMLKTWFVLMTLSSLLAAAAAFAAEPVEEPPHWSVELKGGYFYPDISNWDTYHGTDHMWQITGSLGYKILRQLEVGIESGMMHDTGSGLAPLNNTSTGSVQYSFWPLNAYVLYRAVFSEQQWLVPYAGGGWTRVYYQEKTEAQATIRGSANGYHGRAGIQILLDDLDTSASNNLFLDFGIGHTYLIFEAQYSRVMVDTVPVEGLPGSSVNIGGTSYLGGFLFEF